MQLSEFWKIFLKCAQYGGAAVSFVLNSTLMFLILYRSPASLGTYKYLMLYIVIFQITYSMCDLITELTIISYGPAFLVFRNFKNSVLGREQSFYLLVANCGFFAVSLALFAIHFIYRYGALDEKFRDKFLSGHKLILLFLLPIFYGALWATDCAVFFHFDGSTDLFARQLLLETYDTRVEDISYLIFLFYRFDKHNQPHPHLEVFLAMGVLWVLMASLTSIGLEWCPLPDILTVLCVLLWCQVLTTANPSLIYYSTGLNCSQIAPTTTANGTIIPVILMYIPAAILFAFPMMNVDVGIVGSFVAVTLAIYPAIDPLPTMFIVKNFRETLLYKAGISSRKRENVAVVHPPVNNYSVVFAPKAVMQLRKVNIQ